MAKAQIVFENVSLDLTIPEEMGTPRPGQMEGTIGERLAELAGRICYDSLGKKKSRDSREYHQHILDSKHTSVHGHYGIVVEVDWPTSTIAPYLLNRPGIMVTKVGVPTRLVFNPRVILSWNMHGIPAIKNDRMSKLLYNTLWHYLHSRMPQVFKEDIKDTDAPKRITSVIPSCFEEYWIAFYFQGSRGFSHEEVRHGYQTGISQRSTRFVDESESPWDLHPLLLKYLKEKAPDGLLDNAIKEIIRSSQNIYDLIVSALQSYVKENQELDELSARKQARGAARGLLGNALRTEGIFSASGPELDWKFRNRMTDGADAEIRLVYNEAYNQLQLPQFTYLGEHFKYATRPAKDGIGFVIDTN